MQRLIYGIGLASDRREQLLPPERQASAVRWLRVRWLCDGELAAAYTLAPEIETHPEAPELLDYARVIERLHQQGPFAPMRYGCLLSDDDAIRQLLQTHCTEFMTMLDEITGCDEFGLRILPGDSAQESDTAPCGAACDSALEASAGAGARYLSARRRRYAAQESQRRSAETLAARFCEAFRGLYVRAEFDRPALSGSLAALAFLVRRPEQSRFQQRFRDLERESPEKLLMTGPWPPYHFVAIRESRPEIGIRRPSEP